MKNSHHIWSVLLLGLFLIASVPALAQDGGRMLELQNSTELDQILNLKGLALVREQGLAREQGVDAGSKREASAWLEALSPTAKEDDGAGCTPDPASPAIGTDVPLSYFGVPAPTINPSLVGAVQLLTSGPLDIAARTITIPLYRGRMRSGELVWYVVTDTTDVVNAEALGLNHSAKLVFGDTARGSRRAGLTRNGELIFDRGTVDFSPVRQVVPGAEPNPFPPSTAQPGSVGDQFYSPLVKIRNAGGHIYNAPILAFDVTADEINFPDGNVDYSLVHDSVVAIDPIEGTVTLELASGFSFGRPVLYLSLDANGAVPAALEASTLAPGLDDILVGVDDTLFSAVERIFITINGPRACDNPQRQGLNAAVSDGFTPFNVLGGIPTIAPDYSPLWDANIGEWTQEAIDAGYRSRVIDEFQILSFVDNGFMTGPGGAAYGSTGLIINCPIVFRFL